MAKARAVLKRLKAVKNIRKITRTMELIATARFKKAMDRATLAAAYTSKIAELAADLAQSATDFSHPLMEVREHAQALIGEARAAEGPALAIEQNRIAFDLGQREVRFV